MNKKYISRNTKAIRSIIMFLFLASTVWLQGCAGVNTFPSIARSGDTISVMIGGTEKARKDTINATLEDANGGMHDLQSLGLVRSVFALRADGRAKGRHYSPYIDTYISWFEGHEPVQTVLVADLPSDLPPGIATLTINPNVDDDSSGIVKPYQITLEIIAGTGSPDNFDRQDAFFGQLAADFDRLEPAPHAKITFGSGTQKIGAASILVDFDENAVNPDDLNIYSPEAAVRGSFTSTGAFGEHQRMVYWSQDGNQLAITIVAPQGIDPDFLMLYIIHPGGLLQSPNFQILTNSSTVYDINGNEISLLPSMEYFP